MALGSVRNQHAKDGLGTRHNSARTRRNCVTANKAVESAAIERSYGRKKLCRKSPAKSLGTQSQSATDNTPVRQRATRQGYTFLHSRRQRYRCRTATTADIVSAATGTTPIAGPGRDGVHCLLNGLPLRLTAEGFAATAKMMRSPRQSGTTNT